MPDQHEIFPHVTPLDTGKNEKNVSLRITVAWSGAVMNHPRHSPTELRVRVEKAA